MELLKTLRVKAAEWHDTNKIVEGTLFVADRITLEGADPERNQNGYLLFIVDDSGMKHIIAPDTLEIVEMETTSEVGKAVHASFMKLYKANFTFAQVENFWKDCMSSVDVMIESKKRGLITTGKTIDGKILNNGDTFFAICSDTKMKSSGYQKVVPIELIFPQDWHLSGNGEIAYSSRKECLKECKRRNILELNKG